MFSLATRRQATSLGIRYLNKQQLSSIHFLSPWRTAAGLQPSAVNHFQISSILRVSQHRRFYASSTEGNPPSPSPVREEPPRAEQKQKRDGGEDNKKSIFNRFFVIFSALGGLGAYLFNVYMHPEVLEHWLRLIQFGRDDKGNQVVPTPTDSGIYSSHVAIQQLKDPEIRAVLDRASLSEACAAMDLLSCKENCDLSSKKYGSAETKLMFKLLALMNGTQATADKKAIISLTLRDCDIKKPEVAKALRDALQTNRALREITLHRCRIGDESLELIAEAVKYSVWLQKIDLGENSFGDKGIALLSSAIKSASGGLSLTSLSLVGKIGNKKQGGRITDDGARELARSFKRTTGLTELDLSYNDIGESGATALVKSLAEHKHPVKLILKHNSISEPSKEKLIALSKIVSPDGYVQLDL